MNNLSRKKLLFLSNNSKLNMQEKQFQRVSFLKNIKRTAYMQKNITD